MPTYTLTMTTGPADEKGLDMALVRFNQLRARQNRAALTKPQYLQELVDKLVADHKRRYKDEFRARVDAAMNTTASVAQITQVAQILGVEE